MEILREHEMMPDERWNDIGELAVFAMPEDKDYLVLPVAGGYQAVVAETLAKDLQHRVLLCPVFDRIEDAVCYVMQQWLIDRHDDDRLCRAMRAA